jgi:serine/threonine protein kinase
MPSTLFLGQILKGRTGLYTITKQLQDCVWLALYALPAFKLFQTMYHSYTNNRNEGQQNVIAKSVGHFRLQNERDVLLRFQHRTPSIRPLIEELEDSHGPPILLLEYLDDDLLNASNKRRLTRPEVKFVSKKLLEALAVLHDDGLVHTGAA